MKRNLLNTLLCFAILLSIFSCTKNDRYETSVVRQVNMYLNDQPFKINPGITTRPFFIYKQSTGDYFANYMSHYRFALENGGYWFFATPVPTLITDSMITKNVNDLVINQFPKGDQHVQISAAVKYESPFNEPLNLYILSRTGTLRLKATDTQSDTRYTSIRAIVTVKRSGYRIIDESYIETTPLDVIRSLKSDKGGVNYVDDFFLFNTKDEQSGVNIRFELLDPTGNVVKTRTINESVQIFPSKMTLVEFKLNDSDNPIIEDYVVTNP